MAQERADWQGARQMVPYVDADEWSERMQSNPEALMRIIADAYDFALREREARQGRRRYGRRPKPDPVSLDEVYAAAFPTQFSRAPFAEALDELMLMNGSSQRAFAARVPCHQSTLSRMLSGQLKPDASMMERVASAAGVQPWFFAEWRASFVADVVERSLLADPSMSISAVKGLRARAGR